MFNSFKILHLSMDSDKNINGTFQQGELKSMIFNDSYNDQEQVSVNDRNWAKLPSLVVENIYSFLSRPDQSRMSQVCSQWEKHFGSPRVWKKMKFYLPKRYYSSKICPEVRFACKYAYMFRYVEIICKPVGCHLFDMIWRQLKMILQAISSSSEITSIKFIDMKDFLIFLDSSEMCQEYYQFIVEIIISIFNSQDHLKTVVFEDTCFRIEDCLELLKAIFHSDRNTMRNLSLRGFLNEAPPFSEFQRSRQIINTYQFRQQFVSHFSELCHRMANIECIDIDYTQFFEGTMNDLYEKLSSRKYQINKKKPNAWYFSIYCEEQIQTMGIFVPIEFKGILPGTWKCLKNIFPGMKVKMDITIYSDLNKKMEIFLVKEIPLQKLDFRYNREFRIQITDEFEPMPYVDISAFFRHLHECKYEDHLEDLNVVWMDTIKDFPGSVIPFTQSFTKLQTFFLHARKMPSGVENVLKAFLKYHPVSLKSITMWFSDAEDMNILRELSKEYYPLFNSQDIKCDLCFHPGPFRL